MYKRSHFSLLFFLSLVACSQSLESWIGQPPAEWPSMLLANRFRFSDTIPTKFPSFAYAATGFLVELDRDTLAVTAKHLPWVVTYPSYTAMHPPATLQQWVLYTPGGNNDSITVGGLLKEDRPAMQEGPDGRFMEHDDWIIGAARPSSRTSYPLKPRFTPLQENEKVWIISRTDGSNRHTVLEGKVATLQGRYITIGHDTKVDMTRSGGSPVIDANGYLVGILSYSTSDGQTDRPMTVVLSTAYLQDVINKK